MTNKKSFADSENINKAANSLDSFYEKLWMKHRVNMIFSVEVQPSYF